MISPGPFEEELEILKSECEHGSFTYTNSSLAFSEVVSSHFRNKRDEDKHGIYVVRQQSTGKILYVGKGGTIDRGGRFKDQDIPGRLRAERAGHVKANDWFGKLVAENGPLVIEYIFLTTTPKSPALMEAILLQAYFNEHGCLPYRNNAF